MTDQSLETQFNVVKSTVAKNIETFRSKREFNRARAFALRLTIVTIGALTTISLGLKPYANFTNSDSILSGLALLLSASIPIFAAWEAFFDHRWLWIRYTGTLSSLYAIRDELDFAYAAGAIEKTRLDSLFLRLQDVLEDVDMSWSKRRNDALQPQAQPPGKVGLSEPSAAR